MERLKTPAEKTAEIAEFRKQQKLLEEQRELRNKQRKLLEEQHRLQNIEMCKICIIQIINACTDMPIHLSENDDVWYCLDDDDIIKAINIWLEENGYMITTTTNSYGCNEYSITMK